MAGGLNRDALAGLVADGVKRFGWKAVFIDYLGLLTPTKAEENQFAADIANSTALLSLAKSYGLAVIIVASARKGSVCRQPSALTIDDVAGAGRLVYDATTVSLVWCEHSPNPRENSGLVCVRVLKSRFWRSDVEAQLRWRPWTGRIEDLAPADGADGKEIEDGA